jgi:hypothetical protein
MLWNTVKRKICNPVVMRTSEMIAVEIWERKPKFSLIHRIMILRPIRIPKKAKTAPDRRNFSRLW